MLFGHDAATALCQHSNFRRDAAEIMSRALDLDDFLYNVYSGTAFIPDTARDSGFYMEPRCRSRRSSRTAYAARALDRKERGGVCGRSDSIRNARLTTPMAGTSCRDASTLPEQDADGEHRLPAPRHGCRTLCDDRVQRPHGVEAGLRRRRTGRVDARQRPRAVAETCASLGVDIATARRRPYQLPARVVAAGQGGGTKATTHGVTAAAGNRL